jgi:hypothetical protein
VSGSPHAATLPGIHGRADFTLLPFFHRYPRVAIHGITRRAKTHDRFEPPEEGQAQKNNKTNIFHALHTPPPLRTSITLVSRYLYSHPMQASGLVSRITYLGVGDGILPKNILCTYRREREPYAHTLCARLYTSLVSFSGLLFFYDCNLLWGGWKGGKTRGMVCRTAGWRSSVSLLIFSSSLLLPWLSTLLAKRNPILKADVDLLSYMTKILSPMAPPGAYVLCL